MITRSLGLGFRVGLATLAITLLFVILTAVAGTWISYHAGMSQMDNDIAEIREGYLPGINSAVWELAENRIEAELKVIEGLPYVLGVDIESGPHQYHVGKLEAERIEQFPLVHKTEGVFGQLRVAFDVDALRSDVLNNAMQFVLYMILPFIALAFAFLVIFERMVTKHISALSQYARKLDLDTLDQQFESKRTRLENEEHGDELDQLVHSIDTMRGTILEQVKGRQLVEQQLGESRRDYQEIVNAVSEAVFIHDAENGKIVAVNRVASELYGYTEAELLALSVEDLSLGEEPYTQNEAGKFIALALAGDQQLIEWRAKKKSGELFWAEVSLRLGNLQGKKCVLASVRDVSERRRAEDQLAQLQKMDSIGQLAGGIAHDFNNMLGGIIGGAELLQLLHKDDEQSQRYIDLVLQAARRAAELTGKMLAYSRKGVRERVNLDLHDVIDDACGIIERSIDRRIELKRLLNADMAGMVGDRTLIQNCIMNLCINAADAMPEGGTLTIETENIVLNDEAVAVSPFELEPGTFIQLSVYDTGHGIPENVRKHIFEPFFTTKEVGRGTGMGLASVFGTVTDHAGSITVYSEIDEGTVFHVLLPVDPSIEPTMNVEEAGETPHGTGIILLVDDEDVVRVGTEQLLKALGYTVITASNGVEAVDEFKQHQQAIDVVLLDMIMPQMSGRDCFFALRELRSDLPIVLCSGFTKKDIVEELQTSGLFGYLKKPVRMHDLARMISRACQND